MNIGDVVYLNSGSRPMTIVQIDGDTITCSWDGGSQQYPAAALTTDDPSPALDQARADTVASLSAQSAAKLATPDQPIKAVVS